MYAVENNSKKFVVELYLTSLYWLGLSASVPTGTFNDLTAAKFKLLPPGAISKSLDPRLRISLPLIAKLSCTICPVPDALINKLLLNVLVEIKLVSISMSPICAFPVFISFQVFVALPKFNKSSVLLGNKSCEKFTKSKSIVSLAWSPISKLPPTKTLPGTVTLPVALTSPVTSVFFLNCVVPVWLGLNVISNPPKLEICLPFTCKLSVFKLSILIFSTAFKLISPTTASAPVVLNLTFPPVSLVA